MLVIGTGLNGKIACHTCGQLAEQPASKYLDHPTCAKCGKTGFWGGHLDSGMKNFTACEEPEKYSCCGAHAHFSSNLDGRGARYIGKGHEHLGKRLAAGDWVMYFTVSSTSADFEMGSDPERSPWLMTFNGQIKAYQCWYALPGNQEDLYVAVQAVWEFIRSGREKQEKDFFISLAGKRAIDNGTSTQKQHAGRDYRAGVLEKIGWVNWESRKLTHAGAHTSDYWLESSSQGVRDLLDILDSSNPERGRNPIYPEVHCWLDEERRTLYVMPGSEGRWIGKQGVQINKLSKALGYRLQVKPIQLTQGVSWSVGKRYIDGATRTAIVLVAKETYACGAKSFTFVRPHDRGGMRIISSWLDAQGATGIKYEGEFPLVFCEEMMTEPARSFDDNIGRRAIRSKKRFGAKTIVEWYKTLFGGQAYEAYIETALEEEVTV